MKPVIALVGRPNVYNILGAIGVAEALGLPQAAIEAGLARLDGVPGRFQAAVEILVEMVESQAKGIVHNAQSRKLVAPLALTVFVWIFLMNALDLLPLDLLPEIGLVLGIHYMRIVPTADLNATLAMSIVVLSSSIYYGIKIKHPGGFFHELFTAPFGTSKNPLLALILGVINFALQLVEYAAKTISLGMRL